MRKYRKLLISAALLIAVLAAAALLLYYRIAQPPETARLLPEGDLIFHASLKPVHAMDLTHAEPVVETLLAIVGIRPADYRDFALQTGIHVEADIDQVSMSRRDTADGRDVESSEILAGRFDSDRLRNYLQKISSTTEQYREHTIYAVQHEGHLVRVALLDKTRVAVTNMASPELLHGIIDRSQKPARGPWLLEAHYHDVPSTSLAWFIDRLPNHADNVHLPGGLSFSFPPDSIAVASLRYTGSLLFRADVFTQSDAQAKDIVDAANTHLSLVRSIGQSMGARGPDKDIKAAFDSVEATQKENVAVFTATIPQSLLRIVLSEAQNAEAPSPPTPSTSPTPRHRKR